MLKMWQAILIIIGWSVIVVGGLSLLIGDLWGTGWQLLFLVPAILSGFCVGLYLGPKIEI